MEASLPDHESKEAAEGTRAHTAAAKWLQQIVAGGGVNPDTAWFDDEEMQGHVYKYVDAVLRAAQTYRGAGAKVTILVEQPLPLDDVTGERGQKGTGDVVLIVEFPDRALVHVFDLKYGQGVEVDDDTPQLKVYAVAAVRKYGLMLNFTHALTTVAQPRLRSEFNTVEHEIKDLEAFGEWVMGSATTALELVGNPAAALDYLVPGDKQCRWCKAARNLSCPAYNEFNHQTVFGEIQAIDAPDVQPIGEDTFDGSPLDFHQRLLPLFMTRVPMVEAWCSYVKAKTEQQLLQGHAVAGFKLVQGRMGARQWTNEQLVLTTLAANRVDRGLVMEPSVLKSPAQLEKALKKAYPSVFNLLGDCITQAPGKPSVAPESDPRPQWAAATFDGDSYDAAGLV